MGKGNGSTRASSSKAPKGLSNGGGYKTFVETFIDEDTGERIEITRQISLADLANSENYEKAYKELEERTTVEENKLRSQLFDNTDRQLSAERELASLRETKRVFESDMEDELGHLSGVQQDKRAGWYGSQLNRIDRQIASQERIISQCEKTEERINKKQDALDKRFERENNKLKRKYKI